MRTNLGKIPWYASRLLGCAVLVAGLALPRTCLAALPLQPSGWVNDFAGVIESGARQQLERALADLEQRTGAEVTVVTVDTVPDGDVDRAAVELFESWGIGKKHHDNGVLILCAVRDRRVRIEVGYGLEAILPDARTGRIIDSEMLPAFRRGDLSTGLVRGARAVADIIAANPDAAVAPAAERPSVAALVAALLILTILLILLARHPELFAAVYTAGGRGPRYGGFPPGGFGGSLGRDGGFGGFGGGLSGGGGASRGW